MEWEKNYVKWSNSDTNNFQIIEIHVESRKADLIEVENRMIETRGWDNREERGMGSNLGWDMNK
jgi:hypothetical protein